MRLSTVVVGHIHIRNTHTVSNAACNIFFNSLTFHIFSTYSFFHCCCHFLTLTIKYAISSVFSDSVRSLCLCIILFLDEDCNSFHSVVKLRPKRQAHIQYTELACRRLANTVCILVCPQAQLGTKGIL